MCLCVCVSGYTRRRAREGAEAATHFSSEGSPPTHRGNKASDEAVLLTPLTFQQKYNHTVSVYQCTHQYVNFVCLWDCYKYYFGALKLQ